MFRRKLQCFKKDAEVYGETLTLTTNFKNVIDLSNETPIKTTEEYIEAGYDGATFMYGDRREAVAFREPFEKAGDTRSIEVPTGS